MGLFEPAKRDKELDNYMRKRKTYMIDGVEYLRPNIFGLDEEKPPEFTHSIHKKINGYTYNFSPDDDPQPLTLKAIIWFGFFFILVPLLLIRFVAGVLLALH